MPSALRTASNPLPIILPCHRVIGADGSLTGFGGGLHVKRHLLEHEGALLPLGQECHGVGPTSRVASRDTEWEPAELTGRARCRRADVSSR